MNSEDIRAMYERETPATAAEVAQLESEVRHSPDLARQLLLVMYSLGESAEFAELLGLVVKVGAMQLIAIQAYQDDAFALKIADLILQGLHAHAQPARGRPKKARSA